MSSGLSRRTFLATVVHVVAAGSGSAAWAGGKATAKFDVDRFTDEVRRARMEADSQAAVEEVLRRAVSEPSTVLEGIGEPTEAGIHTIYQGADLTILNVVWAPLMVLLPHNHNMWASIGIYTGREDNIVWERRGPVIEATGAAALSEKEVFNLATDAIHSVTNPIRRRTGAIHIYGGDFIATRRSAWDAETLRERPFDFEETRRQFREANDRFEAGR